MKLVIEIDLDSPAFRVCMPEIEIGYAIGEAIHHVRHHLRYSLDHSPPFYFATPDLPLRTPDRTIVGSLSIQE